MWERTGIVSMLEAYEGRRQERDQSEPSSFLRDRLLPFMLPAVLLGSALYSFIRIIAKAIVR